MSQADTGKQDAAGGPPGPREDMTGRQRMLWNVVTSWAGHLVFVAAGFILPRLISDELGQHRLGVWDFAWSLVTYFALVQGGIVSSINRYVAMHRAAGDQEAINRSVSSVTLILIAMAGLIVVLAIAVAMLLPTIWQARLGEEVRSAQWVTVLLGASLALQTAYSGYGGVITGCHRWDLHNGIYAGTYIATTIGMIAALYMGGGLVAMAAVTLACEFAGRTFRAMAAYRVCPGLRVRMSLADLDTARGMLGFGVKTYVPAIGEMLLNQTVALLVFNILGPAALAIFSRPRALVRHAATMVAKFANVLVPTASSLSTRSDPTQLRELALRTTRFGALMALPMILVLAMLGGPLLQIWMGREYRNEALAAILAIGPLATIVHQPLISVLSGLNAHGIPGIASFVASVITVIVTTIVLQWHDASLETAAYAAVVPSALIELGFIAGYACKRLGIRPGEYWRRVWLEPIACNLPLIAAMGLTIWLIPEPAWMCLAVALTCGGIVTALVYWRWALTPGLKLRIGSRLGIRAPAMQPVDGAP